MTLEIILSGTSFTPFVYPTLADIPLISVVAPVTTFLFPSATSALPAVPRLTVKVWSTPFTLTSLD